MVTVPVGTLGASGAESPSNRVAPLGHHEYTGTGTSTLVHGGGGGAGPVKLILAGTGRLAVFDTFTCH